jgi:membrane-associated phospholipid phosphatase
VLVALHKKRKRANKVFARLRYVKITLLGLLMLVCTTHINAQNTDIGLLRKIHTPHNPGLDRSMRVVSGSAYLFSGLVPAASFMYARLVTRASIGGGPSEEMRKPFVIASSLGLGVGLIYITKISVARPRPFVTYSDIVARDHVGPYSFPSGHTGTAFALATSVSMCYPEWQIIVPAYVWASAVGYSRMRLGVHYPSDVGAGAIIGAASAVTCFYINKKLIERIKQDRPIIYFKKSDT